MASIRKRGNSYLLVVSMGYTPDGRRRNPQQKTVKLPTGLTPKQTEKWLQEQAMLFEMSCKKLNPDIDRSITLEKYTEIWLQTIAPDKLAKSTLVREKQDIERFKPYLGSYKLVDLRPEHFRSLYAKLRKQKNIANGKPLSEATVEGVHSCLCGILSDAMEGGYLDHNPAWRTYKYAGQKKEKKIADDETVKKLIKALEAEAFSTKRTSSSSSPQGCGAANAVRSNGRISTTPSGASTSAGTQSKRLGTKLSSKRRRRKQAIDMCTFLPKWKVCSVSTKPSARQKRSAMTGESKPRTIMCFAERAWSCR